MQHEAKNAKPRLLSASIKHKVLCESGFFKSIVYTRTSRGKQVELGQEGDGPEAPRATVNPRCNREVEAAAKVSGGLSS